LEHIRTKNMPTSAAKPFQLDLRAQHCWHLSLSATITPTPAKLVSLRELAGLARRGDRWPWVFSDTYSVEEEWYTAQAMVHPAKQPGALAVHVDFSRGRGKSIRRQKATVLSLLETLSDQDATADVQSQTHFDYKPDEGVSTPALPLEIQLPEGGLKSRALPDGPGPRFQVRGLRLTHLDEEGSIDSSVVIDRPSNAEFHLTVSFSRSSVISPELPGVLLSRASEIAKFYFRITEQPSSSKAAGARQG